MVLTGPQTEDSDLRRSWSGADSMDLCTEDPAHRGARLVRGSCSCRPRDKDSCAEVCRGARAGGSRDREGQESGLEQASTADGTVIWSQGFK